MEYQPPQFFKRGPAPLARLTFFGLVSVLLMVLDARFQYAEPLRHGLTLAIYPLQQVATAPVVAFNSVSDYFSSQSRLRRENAALRAEQLENAQSLLVLEAIASENERLRKLLDARETLTSPAVFAEIVYAGRDPFSRKVIIDRGSQHGIEAGQPVVDGEGVLGQVTRVLPLLAEVTLVTDKNHSIPVQILRNGLRGIAYGSGDGSTLELRFVPANADVQTNDVLVTSGLDGVYPRGLPVATVTGVERDTSNPFARVRLAPTAGTDKHRQVLVVQYKENIPSLTEAEAQAQEAASRDQATAANKAAKPERRQ